MSSDDANQCSTTELSETLLLHTKLQQTGFKRKRKAALNRSELTSTVRLDHPTADKGCLRALSKPAGSMRPNKRNFSTVFPNINTNTILMLG